MLIFQKDNLLVRKIAEADVPLVARWLSDPEVLAYYDGRDNPSDEARVRAKLLPRQGDPVTACLFEWDGVPIGFLQFYPAADDPEAYGMDQFIGETAYWNRGIGTKLVQAMVLHLTETAGATRIVMDPEAWNERALRCYEKCGFRKVKLLPAHELHEGQMRDCWLIEYVKTPLSS